MGIDVISLRLKNGIYSPTWLLAMNPDWYAKVGGDAGLQNAVGSSVQAQHYAGGVILQAGDYPEPLPTSEALPTLWKNYNAWLKPIRNKDTDCFHITTLSEEQDFDEVTTRMWYERMDAGAVWPPTVEAYEACFEVLKREAAAKEALPPQATTPALMAHPSQPCPKAGLWFAPLLQNKTVRMQLGEPMPVQTMAPSGAVIWYYKGP